jgi:hypothetical protein
MSHTAAQTCARTYRRLTDLPHADQVRILARLKDHHAPRLARHFHRETASLRLEDALDYIGEFWLSFLSCVAPEPLTAADFERWVVGCFFQYGPHRLARQAARRARAASLEELIEAHGDGWSPESLYGIPSDEMTEEEALRLLEELGVHRDWLCVYRWRWIEGRNWEDAALRLQTRCGFQTPVAVLKKRWSRLCLEIGPGIGAGLAGLPVRMFRLEPAHWAAQPMQPPIPRKRRGGR